MSARRSGRDDEWYIEHLGEPPEKMVTSGRERHKMAREKLYEVMVHYGYDANKAIGKQWIRCPFHDDRHASAAVDWSTNYFTCFACDMKGTALDIVMKKEGVNLDGAVSFVASL